MIHVHVDREENTKTAVDNKRALITGITGFAGSHLAEHLLNQEIEVYGLCRWRSPRNNITHILKHIRLLEGDLLDQSSLRSAIKESKPDFIFHLAAQSYVATSWKLPIATLNANIIGTCNLLEAIRESKYFPTILLACSSEEYGLVFDKELPIKETNPLRPLSPYGVSKVAVDMLGYQYYKSHKMKIIRTRAFNHTGPRRGSVFVTSSIAKQIVEIMKRKRDVITVGPQDSIRDFTDVRDMVRAYYLAVRKGEPGEVYNICSGNGMTIKAVIEKFLAIKPHLSINIQIDHKLFRPSDVRVLIGDCAKFKEQTGWEPKIPLEQTFEDMLEYWFDHVE